MYLDADLKARIVQHFSKDPRNYIVVLSTADGKPLYELEDRDYAALLHPPSIRGKTILSTVEYEPGNSLRVASLATGSIVIHVGFQETSMLQVLHHTLFVFSLLAPVVLLVSVAGGWMLAGLALRPVADITDRTRQITVENLAERIPVRHVDDELGRLIGSINFTLARLESSFEQMKQFSMNVAHELKTPLTIMRGEAELALGNERVPEEYARLLTMVLEETGRMAHIVDDLLTLAKAEAGQIVLERSEVGIQMLVQDLYDDAVTLAVPKNLSVLLDVNEPARVMGNTSRPRQLFRILLSNAVQYTDQGGTIRISNRILGGEIHVTIQDTGIGIPEESLTRIFERFYRVDQARTRAKGGSGLGLPLAQWIVRSHFGHISVESKLGTGSTFTVFLPAMS
jgi:heavy metal sensor kinase